MKCSEVKHTEEMSKWEGERNREQQNRGQREVALVEIVNGVGLNGPLVKSTPEYF
jgi:hypothetical protein